MAQKLFGVHSAPSKTKVELQRTYKGLGAGFGQPLTYEDITFAIKREPIAHRIVFAVAHDVLENDTKTNKPKPSALLTKIFAVNDV